MAYYRQAIVKDADYGPAHRQLAFLQMSKNDFTAAAASLRKAIICDSKDVAAGQALVELWRKQVAQNPLLAENHLGLAGAMQLTGDFAGAEGEYRRLEALDPRNPGLESGRASLKRAYQHAIAEKHRMAAETLFSQGLRREALGEINQAVMMEDKNPKYLYLMAECLEGVGNYQAAHAAYLKVVILDPTKVEAAERAKEMQKNMGMSSAQVAQMSGQIANQITAQPMQHQAQPHMQQPQPMQPQQMQAQQMQQQQMQQQQFAAQPPGSFRVAQPEEQPQQLQQHDPSRKSMFEGGSQRPAFNPQAMNFRTHDESQQAQAEMEQEMRQQQARQAAMQAQQAQQAQAQQAAQQQAQAQQQSTQAAPSINDALSQVSVLESQRDYQGAATLLKQLCEADVQNPELHHRLATNLLNLGQIVEAIPEFRIASALKPTMKAYSDDLARAMAIHKRSLMSDKSDSSVSGSK
jgi:tetratricopeptide (TPR) repeat protein